MYPKKFALVFGIFTLAVGVLSLLPTLVGPRDGLPALDFDFSYGYFLNTFALNFMNKMALIGVGTFGILAGTAKFNGLPRAINYARAVCGLMIAMAVLGSINQTSTLFGYWPLFGMANITATILFAVASGFHATYLTSQIRDSGPAVREFTAPLTR